MVLFSHILHALLSCFFWEAARGNCSLLVWDESSSLTRDVLFQKSFQEGHVSDAQWFFKEGHFSSSIAPCCHVSPCWRWASRSNLCGSSVPVQKDAADRTVSLSAAGVAVTCAAPRVRVCSIGVRTPRSAWMVNCQSRVFSVFNSERTPST